ncbi:MAG TPA: hypothetical protein VNY53_08695, partial [Bradyrhizobium sp.]|nr:hypothetical protein [Bradyrhizobium sp.]
ITVVAGLAPDDVEVVARSAAFEQALAALGWTKGGTIAIDYHWVANDPITASVTRVRRHGRIPTPIPRSVVSPT